MKLLVFIFLLLVPSCNEDYIEIDPIIVSPGEVTEGTEIFGECEQTDPNCT